MKILQAFFNFGKKYRKREEEYERKSRKFGTSGELLTLFFLSAVPLLSLWGLFSDIDFIWKIILFFFAASICYIPGELMIIGIVALRHRMKKKLESKITGAVLNKTVEVVSGEEVAEEVKEENKNYKSRGTADTYDLVVGVLGIVLSIFVVAAFIILFFLFLSQTI